MLDEHFRDLGSTVGIVQPRSAIAKHKHIELQADTLRVLALSLLADEQVLTMTSFAERMWSTWSSSLAPEHRTAICCAAAASAPWIATTTSGPMR